ncbi:uncharacterized protein HaLaN_29179 [Haematococcus lacustris]|uniref:Uncharacterized protein n=1 Tax=Haematococcus lacustris TaxID=44745 RepID=A0A6A0AE29_HAELA|nr:uncharacterized protein HaLaN_29179 [Haematococcus lacustris]
MEDVFVMVSLSKYDLYSMARGPYAGCKVAAVQTNDDAKEEETQTNEPAQRAYAAQVPDDRNKMSEAEVFAFSMEVGASGGAEARSRVQASSTMGAATSRVMNICLPRPHCSTAHCGGKEVTFRPPAAGSQGLSGGLLHLNWPELLDQRPDASRPVLQEAFMVQGNDPTLAALPTQLVAAGLQPGGKSTAAVPMFALGYDDGSVRAHALAPAHQAGPGVEVEVRVMQQLLNLPQQTLVANGHGGAGK